ncbi:MAG: glucose-6-phosphate dehydrogenase [Planctomycetes bacterium]|nr:glucose-6-phosphate dehydrogenase [Planctomycetota bacterium]
MQPVSLVIFGASGDLTSRKLVPALYQLYQRGRLPEGTRVLGVARRGYTSETWRAELAASTAQYESRSFQTDLWQRFAECLHYQPGDIENPRDFQSIRELLDQIEQGRPATRLYYLSTLPRLYEQVTTQLGEAGLADESQGSRRIIVEKPFGSDLESARNLNHALHRVFSEKQVFRIDHYLGKETVQNLLVLRFANSIFEPIWNRNYIDHVQITVAEEVDVGSRGAYYDEAGVLRDMVQNHLLQLMMITAMEAPARYDADLVRDEKVKVLRSVRPLEGADFAQNTLRGQYEGYRQTDGVPANSQTATFVALKLNIDNWRWNGVPFYLRSGKAMSCRTSQIVIQFRTPPHMLFSEGPRKSMEANRLVIQVQPAEGIHMHFQSKVPDAGMRFNLSHLDFRFQPDRTQSMPDAYQRLLLDAMSGDASLFARSDEVELAWSIVDPILAAWKSPATPRLLSYPPADWGPAGAVDWIERDGRSWYDVCPVF